MEKVQLFRKPLLLLFLFLVSSFCFSQVTEQWVKRYNGPYSDDIATFLTADAHGNVYVTGNNGTIKYDAAGNELWARSGSGSSLGEIRSGNGNTLAVDVSGNVYVTGINYLYPDSVTTRKYDANGNELWVRRYNEGTGFIGFIAPSLVIDDSGNVYVTGGVLYDAIYYGPYITIKYDTNGNLLWVKRYDATGIATSVAVDASGNVYITGLTDLTADSEYWTSATVKYDAAGNEQWVRRYNIPGEYFSDYTPSLALDAFGNVYVTGGDGTIKYDAAGNELWVKRINIGDGGGSDIAIDGSGNVYVTGGSTIKYDAAGNELWVRSGRGSNIAIDANGNVYVTGGSGAIKYDTNGNELWARSLSGLSARSLAIDASGNVYVTGGSQGNEGNNDYTTVKYDVNGNELWVKGYNGPGNGGDGARSLAIDASGNVYVTGGSQGSEGNNDYTTVKYDVNGNELWVKRYNGPGNGSDEARSLAIDASGNVYVTGRSQDSESYYNYVTIKYDANGNKLWIRRYNGPENGWDIATSLAVDASGNVYVTGESNGDYATVKYDTNGKELWVRRYNGSGNRDDRATSLAVDASGNVYITGMSYGIETDNDYATIKYNTNGNELWIKRYNGSGNGSDEASYLAIDANGNVYVTGGSEGSGTGGDYATIKYDVNGNELWVKRYNGLGNGGDAAISLAVDASGNVYVTGGSGGIETGPDFATIKYDAIGNELWVNRYHGHANYDDVAQFLAVDSTGNVYVTGWSSVSDFNSEYITIKYDVNGNEQWVKRYNGQGDRWDGPTSLAVDASGNVYVTGGSEGSGTGGDYATIKYVQTQTAVVSSFTLINADSDEDIRELKDGDTLNLAALSSLNLNIRANTTPTTTGSVVFNLSGKQTRNHTENIAPYALFANNKQDYYAWTPSNGNYTLTATPYEGKEGSGEKGTPLTVHFHVIYQVVKSFTLVNADTEQDIGPLEDGDTLDLSTLPTQHLNIRANTSPSRVGSVAMDLDGKIEVENGPPYTYPGDQAGNYFPMTLTVGEHTLTATPYSQHTPPSATTGKGHKGKALTITFTVIATAVNSLVQVDALPPARLGAASEKGKASILAIPNPSLDEATIRFSVPKSGYTTLEVYDMKGVLMERLYQAQAEGGKAYTITFESKQLKSGVYIVRLATGQYVESYMLVVMQ